MKAHSLFIKKLTYLIPAIFIVSLLNLRFTQPGRTAVPANSAATRPSPADEAPDDGTTNPFPKTPPDTSKIHVGDPDVAGYAEVSGESGSVPPGAAVAVVNLSAHNLITDS